MDSKKGNNGERSEWQRHVSTNLEKLNNNQDELRSTLSNNKVETIDRINDLERKLSGELSEFKVNASKDIASLKVKSGIFGTIGGFVVAGVMVLIRLLSN